MLMGNGAVARRVAGSTGIAGDADTLRRNNICAGW